MKDIKLRSPLQLRKFRSNSNEAT